MQEQQQHPKITTAKVSGKFPDLLNNLRLTQLSSTGFHYLDKKLVFLYNEATRSFDPYLIDDQEFGPLVASMKVPPRDTREPSLNYVIDTIPLDYYAKYRHDRQSDDLTNSQPAIMRVVKSGELSKFSFYLNEEILFISDIVNKGRLFTANWSRRPRLNMSELTHLNSQFFIKFGKNIPNLALHIANILETGSTLLLLSRSTRSIRSSPDLTKIERMFFWHSTPGDGVYKLYTTKNQNGIPFDLSDDGQVFSALQEEILTPVNKSYYLRPELRTSFIDNYYAIRDAFVYGPARPLHEVKINNSRLELPGSIEQKSLLEMIHSEVKTKIGEGFKYPFQHTFYNRASTYQITRIGSRQIRTNIFRLLAWLQTLKTVVNETNDVREIPLLVEKIDLAKYLLFLNTLIFRTGRIDAAIKYNGS